MKISGAYLSKDNTRVYMQADDGLLAMSGVTPDIVRCIFTKETEISEASSIGIGPLPSCPLRLGETKRDGNTCYTVETDHVLMTADRETGKINWYKKEEDDDLPSAADTKGWRHLVSMEMELTRTQVEVWSTGKEPPKITRVKTVDGDRNFVSNLKPQADHTAFRAKLIFCWKEKEQIHGLGQAEEGIYDYRGKVQYLYQHNMRIPMPWLLSDQGYAVLADCGSLMTFNDDVRGSWLFLETVPQLDYYFAVGGNVDELVARYRCLTGKCAMLPKWAFGYVQSKERYESQEELVSVAREYRRRGIGLDVVVQDWKTWAGDRWGEKHTDPERFPDLKKMREELHKLNVHSMVSVWPNMNYDTEDCMQMQRSGFLLHDLATYDAFVPDARALYWKQAYEGLYKDGFDSWWCDSTEPFSGPDWGGETMREPWERFVLVGSEHKKFLGAERANLYALAHARGIYENQRRDDGEHRVLNLTRSGYAGIQQYGCVLWSGDVSATWDTLQAQIAECLNMAISGIPFWTFDAGGFFVVKENWEKRGCGCHEDPTPKWFWHGDFEDGIGDPRYRELYVRWLQMAAFLPMFRSHGTDTPREIWQFGEEGTPFYDAIAETIRLRYRLIPYIYSLAGMAWLEDRMMIRPLLADFAKDPGAAGEAGAFLLGRSLLVFPVTRPMQVLPDGKTKQEEETWNCYLPAGTDWYDLYTGRKYPGGEETAAPAPLDRIPVFVRAGSILPMEEGLTYAQEILSSPLQLRIYPGENGSFDYYEDAGDGYAYEQGEYNRIRFSWDDERRTLRIEAAQHRFPGGIAGRTCEVICQEQKKTFIYDGREITITL